MQNSTIALQATYLQFMYDQECSIDGAALPYQTNRNRRQDFACSVAEKNTAKYSIKGIKFIIKQCLTYGKFFAPYLCAKFFFYVLSASGI